MRIPTLTAAILLAAMSPVAFAEYTATILNPPPTGSDVGNNTTNNARAIFNGQQAGDAQVNGATHAYYWNSAAPGTDYNGGSSYVGSSIYGLSATLAVGKVGPEDSPTAAFWNIGNKNPNPLPATNYNDSFATAISGSTIAGFGVYTPDNGTHALVWTGTTSEPTDLQLTSTGPTMSTSTATSTTTTHAVGFASFTSGSHAALWDLNKATVIDLQDPAMDLQNSQAAGISGNQIVGFGQTTGGTFEALLWTFSETDDSITSYTTLALPDGYTGAGAAAISGSFYAGTAFDSNGLPHAVVWTSPTTPEILPSLGGDFSQALGVDAQGNVVGTINYFDGHSDAVLWSPASTPIPEPASLALLLPAATLLLRRRKNAKA